MELEYKMIIIDDDDNLCEEYKQELQDYFDKKGFILDVDCIQTFEEFMQISENLYKYNLFLVDLKFGLEDIGNKIVKNIKEKMRVADVLFYSSSIEEINTAKTSGEYEGVYFAKRRETHPREILEYAEELLNKQILNANSASNFRGVVLQNMSVIDHLMRNIISLFLEKMKSNEQKLNLNNYHLEKINENLESNYKRFVRKIDKDYTFDHLSGYEVVKNNKKDFLKEFIIDYKFNDSYRIYLLLAHILNIIKYPQKKHISDIYISLNTLRNICAHANVYHFRDIDKLESIDGIIELTESACDGYRKKIIVFYKSLEEVKQFICKNDFVLAI